MTPLKEIFLEVSELPPPRRAALLDVRCGGDAELRQRVQALLDAHDLGEIHDQGPTVDVAAPATPPAPQQIGPYRILEQIGEGGFAHVYLAEQERPVRRRVALKILKPGMDSRSVLARFDAERQALAVMSHPNVAKVFDAGVTETGRPYFVMEHVPGESVTTFCDRQQYTTRQRLELFGQACAAVQHAHQKALIHRDLKPSNILVMMQDDAPLVKVIDFGVAKALVHPLTERTLFTGSGQLIGTPEYMPPEQAELSARDVDTRSDVYSLGVVLYELLAGALPFDAATLRSAGYDEIQRIIREVDPPRPSTRLSGLAGRGAEVARKRQTHLTALQKELRGELEWIPLKAMRKERDRRYASAAQLAEDIRNYLEQRPLIAGPESKAYRVRKFARRNRGPIAAVAALVLALLLGVVTTSVMYVRAEHERRETLRQKEIAQSRFDDVRKLANTFLFDVHEKIAHLPGATPARASLVRTALEYLQKLSAQAGDDRGLLREIAMAYVSVGDVQGNPASANLGDTRGALDSYRKALDIDRKLVEAEPANVGAQRHLAIAHERIGDILAVNGDTSAAMNSHREALRLRQTLLDADPASAHRQRELSISHNRIGDVLAASGDVTAALESYRRWLSMAQKLADAAPANVDAQRDLSVAHDRVGDMLRELGDTDAALASQRTAMEITQRIADADPTDALARRDLAIGYNRISQVLAARGDTKAAIESQRKSLAIHQKLADADPTNARARQDVMVSHNWIGVVLLDVPDASGALRSFREALRIAQKLADDDPANANAQRDLKLSHDLMGDALAALADLRGALSSYRTAMGIAQRLVDADPNDAVAQRDLWISLQKTGGACERMAQDTTRDTGERIESWRQAREWYVRQEALVELMKKQNLLSEADAKLVEQGRTALAQVEAAIAKLAASAAPATQPGSVGDP